MKALILNGSLKEDKTMATVNKLMEEILTAESYEVESVLLNEKTIAPCIGCFGCWLRTPGICVIDDYGRILAEKMIKSDIMIWLTPVVYGGYSSELKKALDRIIPLILPFFKKVNGEIHHKERYENYPKIVVLGMTAENDNEMKEIFNNLIKRNSLNWYNSFSGGVINAGLEEDIKYQLKEKFKVLEVSVC